MSSFQKIKDYFIREEWIIAIRPLDSKLLFEEGGSVKPFRVIPNSFRYWCADPFIISVDDMDYLFFEMFDRFKGKGEIGYRIIDESGKIGRMNLAYKSSNHLSFPFVFEKNGEIYMMPESSYDRKLTLLRADQFPDKWKIAKTWFEGERICDSVVFEFDDNIYLLTQPIEIPYTNAKLNLFVYESGAWIPCSYNPVIDDPSIARMAGSIILNNGVIIRPSQNCSADSYGSSLNFCVINYIDENKYNEQVISEVDVNNIALSNSNIKYYGLHTYNHSKRFEVIDLKLDNKIQIGYML